MTRNEQPWWCGYPGCKITDECGNPHPGACRETQWRVGDRVRLVKCTDEITKLEPDALGTVSFIDDLGTVFVQWDDGHVLGMIEKEGDVIVGAT
jgi:hypothetical protein